jgi:D-alanyl-D-alanine dipeptidase
MTNKTISPAEPITDLKRVPIIECGEPLVDFMEVCPGVILDRPRFNYRRETLVRERVAEAIRQAIARLPKDYHLAVVEGWRPMHIQRRMYLGIWQRFKEKHPDWSDVKLRRVVNRYTAPYDSPKVPPPHSTGGAIDVILVRADGSPYDHTTPYDRFDPACYSMDAPGLSAEATRTRQILKEIFAETVLTNYPSEYWHWSFGDQGWAYRGGHEAALYAQTEPPNYVPHAPDVTDEPLRLLDA